MSKSTPTDSDCRHLSTASALSNKAGITRSTQFDQEAQACQGHTPCSNKGKCCIEVHGGGGLEPVQLGRKTTYGRPKPFGSLKDAIRTLPVSRSLLTFFRRKKTEGGQRSTFLSETLRFVPLINAHKGSALHCLGGKVISSCPRSTLRVWLMQQVWVSSHARAHLFLSVVITYI